MTDTTEETQQQQTVANTEHVVDDKCKIFVSRIPTSFDETPIKRLLEDKLGEKSVVNVALIYPQQDGTEKKDESSKNEEQDHRGFAFVTLDSRQRQKEALAVGTVRGGLKATSSKKYTLYIRAIIREDNDTESHVPSQGVCFLWSNFRCPYGDDCKFAHEGDGACLPPNTPLDDAAKKKKKKCFNFKKGKCKAGDNCPFSHDFVVTKKTVEKRDDSEKDCITWKTKGKCNRGDKCPYRHDEEVCKKVLKKKRKCNSANKERQPLSVRVFGLNYETTESDIRAYFQNCGPIVEITFPTFEDSGRSKGYCGILFQSPKAVAKAVDLDGMELHGRWLRVQAGKMYLKKWEEHHESRKKTISDDGTQKVGEFGQLVKKRKQHGFND